MNRKTDEWLRNAPRDDLERMLRYLADVSLEAGVLLYQKTTDL